MRAQFGHGDRSLSQQRRIFALAEQALQLRVENISIPRHLLSNFEPRQRDVA